jgi:hypothetical protein
MFVILTINAVPNGTALIVAGFYGGDSYTETHKRFLGSTYKKPPKGGLAYVPSLGLEKVPIKHRKGFSEILDYLS